MFSTEMGHFNSGTFLDASQVVLAQLQMFTDSSEKNVSNSLF